MYITDVYRVSFMRDRFSYGGTLRNERKFEMLQNVWFNYNGNEIFKGKIIGIELEQKDNPDYKYKVEIPEEVVKQNHKYEDWKENREDFTSVEIKCKYIFNTPQEAEASARKNLKSMYTLQEREIANYFKRWTQKN